MLTIEWFLAVLSMMQHTINDTITYSQYTSETEVYSTEVNESSMASSSNLMEDFAEVIRICSLFLIPVVCSGNLLTVAVIIKYKRMQTYANALVASLAVTDLIIGTVFLPCETLPFIFGNQMYESRFYNLFMKGPFLYTRYLQLINLVVIAVDRYIAILHPFQYNHLVNKRSMTIAIILMWTLPMPAPICYMIYWNTYVFISSIYIISLTQLNVLNFCS